MGEGRGQSGRSSFGPFMEHGVSTGDLLLLFRKLFFFPGFDAFAFSARIPREEGWT